MTESGEPIDIPGNCVTADTTNQGDNDTNVTEENNPDGLPVITSVFGGVTSPSKLDEATKQTGPGKTDPHVIPTYASVVMTTKQSERSRTPVGDGEPDRVVSDNTVTCTEQEVAAGGDVVIKEEMDCPILIKQEVSSPSTVCNINIDAFLREVSDGYKQCEFHLDDMLEKNLVCVDCLQMICALCLRDHHFGHTIVSIGRLRECKNIRTSMEEDVSFLQLLQENFTRKHKERFHLKKQIEMSSKSLLEKISKAFEQLQSIIKDKQREVCDHIKNFEKTNIEELSNELNKIRQIESSATKVITDVMMYFARFDLQRSAELPQRLSNVIQACKDVSIPELDNKDRYLPERKFSRLLPSLQALANICQTLHPESTTVTWSKVKSDKHSPEKTPERMAYGTKKALVREKKGKEAPGPAAAAAAAAVTESCKTDSEVENLVSETESSGKENSPDRGTTEKSPERTKSQKENADGKEKAKSPPSKRKSEVKSTEESSSSVFKKPRVESSNAAALNHETPLSRSPSKQEVPAHESRASSSPSRQDSSPKTSSSSSSSSSSSAKTGKDKDVSENVKTNSSTCPKSSASSTSNCTKTPNQSCNSRDSPSNKSSVKKTESVGINTYSENMSSSSDENDDEVTTCCPKLHLVDFDTRKMKKGSCVIVGKGDEKKWIGRIINVATLQDTKQFEVQRLEGEVGSKHFKVSDKWQKTFKAHIDSSICHFEFNHENPMSSELISQLKIAAKQSPLGKRKTTKKKASKDGPTPKKKTAPSKVDNVEYNKEKTETKKRSRACKK